jgi:hypothetical protein
LLSPLTFGIPIIVDVFKSDFYKIDKNTRQFNVHFEFKQSFMKDEYQRIYESSNPSDFTNWLRLYPKSEIKGKVLRHRDSLDLNIALNKKTENAIDDFIATHQKSHFLSRAKSIKSEMVAAREMFQASVNVNTVDAYENFLAKYPHSLHTADAFERLINAAETRAFSKGSIDATRDYVKQYLIKFSTYLNSDDLERKKRNFTENIDKLLISTYIKNQYKDVYTEYSEMWKRYKSIQEEIPAAYLKELPKTAERVTNICNLLFELLDKNKTASEQENFIKKVNEDFPLLSNGYSNLLWFILDNKKNVSGTVRIFYNSNIESYVRAIVTNKRNDSRFHGRESFQYDYEEINALEGIDQEEISFKNGTFGGTTKCYKGRKLVWSLEIKDDGEWKYSYYIDGGLAKIITYTSKDSYYEYEFRNGINLTLKELDETISYIRSLAIQESYYDANRIAKEARNNKFPPDIPQNVALEDLLYKLRLKLGY